MKISILVSDLSSNSLVRVYPIAKVLERHHEVEVIGPVLGKGIFAPYRNEFNYKPYLPDLKNTPLEKLSGIKREVESIIDSIEGDVIYAFKPKFTSFGIGLMARKRKKLPLLLDIEDWEAEPFHSASFLGKLSMIAKSYKLNSPSISRLLEGKTRKSDGITVVSEFLKMRFGGTKLSHGVDCAYFDPAKYDRNALREEWGVRDKKIILFAGVIRGHKGVETLVEALKMRGSNSIRLMHVGVETEVSEKIKSQAKDMWISAGMHPHSKMPEFLSLADLVVLPQTKSGITEAQVPGKVYEAMAMAKPVVASRVSDLEDILSGCGWTVEADDASSLAETIRYVLDNPQEAEDKGLKAREKCIDKYSWDAMERILEEVLPR